MTEDSEGYSAQALETFAHACNTSGPEALEGAVIIGHGGRPSGQGPYIQLHATVADGRIREAAFKTYGCPAAIACSNAICEIAKGKAAAELRTVCAQDIAARVGKLPRGKAHCITLALDALADIVRQIT